MKAISSMISKAFGGFASFAFPTPVQHLINSSYCKLFSIELSEFDALQTYKTLNALFTRALVKPRTFDMAHETVISPCDSKIMACGSLTQSIALQVKGMYYSVDELLSDAIETDEKEKIYNGLYINFYLSPRDYHHYHAPMDMYIEKVVHIPGKLLPVNLPSLYKNANLFLQNERTVLQAKDTDGNRFYYVLVGALNVGQMTLTFEPDFSKKIDEEYKTVLNYSDLLIKKGDEIGMFMMGSTVVMLLENDVMELLVGVGEQVKFAQRIAQRKHA